MSEALQIQFIRNYLQAVRKNKNAFRTNKWMLRNQRKHYNKGIVYVLNN